MSAVFVLAEDGTRLMPTFNKPKVRKMLKSGEAVIAKHFPFTIQLTRPSEKHVQEIEFSSDMGSVHDGISIKSEKHEYVHMQADMLTDSKQKHDDRRRNRRTRRNRLRYRKPRFNNRIGTKKKGWFAPSVRDKIENQVRLYEKYCAVCPVASATVEVGKFDTQVLEAVEAGKPVPQGEDYQHGPRYGFDTLREAVLYRDNYTCQCCEQSAIKTPGMILVMHHALYWKGDHTDRMGSLMTLCTECHTTANHQKDGKLWGKEPKSSNKADATFMNTARWEMLKRMQEVSGIKVQAVYGASTKRRRLDRNIPKTHANDAYCIGKFIPKHRTQEEHIAKRRRNNRCLEKFRDAVYIDSRDGKEKSGKDLSCGRTKRKEPRHGDKDLRKFRKEKVSKGCRSIRKQRYDLQPGDTVLYKGKVYTVNGMQNKGKTVSLDTTKVVSLDTLQPKTAKDGNVLAIKVGQKLTLKGKKVKHKVLSINQDARIAVMTWEIGVKPDAVKRLVAAYGGWERVNAE